MRATGVEPARPCGHGILSPVRLPVPPRPRGGMVGDRARVSAVDWCMGRARRVIAAVAGGAACSVAVSWACALLAPQRGWETTRAFLDVPTTRESCFIYVHRGFGSVRRECMWQVDTSPFLGPVDFNAGDPPLGAVVQAAHMSEREYGRGWTECPTVVPWCSRESRSTSYFCEHGSGWPFRAFWYAMVPTHRPSESPRIVQGVLVDGGQRAGGFAVDTFRLRAIPLAPLWWGLLGNTCVYAGVILVVGMARGAAKRGVWRARGRCAGCGYSRAGLGDARCPECGAWAAQLTSPARRCCRRSSPGGSRPSRASRGRDCRAGSLWGTGRGAPFRRWTRRARRRGWGGPRGCAGCRR